jgi:hypothetical protein
MSAEITDVLGFCAPKSDQLNAEDLLAGPMDVTITKVYPGPKNQGAEVEIALKECKPWRPCKTMLRLLAIVWGKDPRPWIGRRLRLWRDPSVLWSGRAEGGIRVSHMSHIDRVHAPVLTESRGKRRPYEVHPMRLRLHRRPARPPPGPASWRRPSTRRASRSSTGTPTRRPTTAPSMPR